MKYLLIKADTNDADYVQSFKLITNEQLDSFLPLFEAIAAFKPYKSKSKSGMEYTHGHNFPYGECLREDLGEKAPDEIYEDVVSDEVFETFADFLPNSEFGIHTIKKIKVYEVLNEVDYLSR